MPCPTFTKAFLILILLVAQAHHARGQHGVIREYAALAPAPEATALRPLFDEPLTDISITLGPDKAYYLTGSAVDANGPIDSRQIAIWRSADRRAWTKIRSIDFGGRAVRSPEIHFLKGRFWLAAGLEGGGTALLRFAGTDLAISAFEQARITERGEDPSLFLDDDGTFYWVMGAGEIARMKPDPLEGLAAAPRTVIQPVEKTINPVGQAKAKGKARGKKAKTKANAGTGAPRNAGTRSKAMHGAHLARINGFYHLFVAERRVSHLGDLGRTGLVGGTDDTFVAVSQKPDDGYTAERYLAFPHAGQTTLFRDGEGKLWATWSCTDVRGVFRLRPGAFPVETVEATRPVWPIGFDFGKPDPPVKYQPQGVMLRPDPRFIYEGGVGFLKPVPMDPVPGQRAAFPWIRDTSVARGYDGAFYMTGTSGNMDAIHLWRSSDLKRFEYLAPAFRLDTSKPGLWYNQQPGRLLWAPEIHAMNNTYWITWCVNGGLGMGLLKSATGKPEGPYASAYEGNRPLLSPNIDASLFMDDDGTPYFVWQGRYIRRMNKAMSDFEGERMELLTVDGEQVGYEGIFMRKIGPWYVVLAAEWNGGGNRADGTYDMMYSVSKKLTGPYTRRRVGVPHGGHSTLFQNGEGRWHLAFFGNDRTAPFRAMPGIIALDVRDTGNDLIIRPFLDQENRPVTVD